MNFIGIFSRGPSRNFPSMHLEIASSKPPRFFTSIILGYPGFQYHISKQTNFELIFRLDIEIW